MTGQILRYSAGKTGLHGDWLAVARAIDHGDGDIWSIAKTLGREPAKVNEIVERMGYLIVYREGQLALEKRGLARLRQAEANGR